jgi:hypothetical protein
MDYQHKYLKYKSKYLYLKSGNTSVDKHKLEFRFKFKIDDENILDYQHKYLKYKSKYLDIKFGGDSKVNRNARDRSEWKPPTKSTTSFFSRFSLSGPKEEEYVRIEKEADLNEKTNFKKGQQQTTAILNQQKNNNEEAIKTKNEKIANEKTRTENRTKLLNKLKKILDNIPYDKKLVNCKLNFCTCLECKVGVNDIKDKKEEKEWCKDGVFKNCNIIDNNCNLEKKPTIISLPTMTSWTSMETYCPNDYKHTKDIASIIKSEINKSKYNIYFDNNKISKENIRILLENPINEAADKNFINSEKKKELIEYIITKLKNMIGSIYV